LKTTTPPEVRRQVLALRRSHSLREVAEITGLPLSTVKTLCARSGVFGDNQALRALMSLPPVSASNTTSVALAPELPAQEATTGIKDVDAMLWLRAVIATEHQGHITKALQAVKRIKTPAKELERAYMRWLQAKEGDMAALFGSMGFADLEGVARSATSRAAVKAEALARFGTADALLADTEAERFCLDALHGLEWHTEAPHYGGHDPAEVAARFKAHPAYLPQTLDDCLFELAHWTALYHLRHPFGVVDQQGEVQARERFIFGELAHIRPRTQVEALDVLNHLVERERLDDGDEAVSILKNLICTR
jgi:hypothetical protein